MKGIILAGGAVRLYSKIFKTEKELREKYLKNLI